MKKTILFALAMMILLPALGFGLIMDWHFPKVTSKHRNQYEKIESDKYDFFYDYVAINTGQQEFCDRISPFTYNVAVLTTATNKKVSSTRSECFHDLALKTSNPALCDKVKPLSTWLYSGSDYNPSACRVEIEEKITKFNGNDGIMSGANITMEEKKEFLMEMGIDYLKDPVYQNELAKVIKNREKEKKDYPNGYTKDMTPESEKELNEKSAFSNYFFRIEKTDDFLDKVKALPLSK